MGNTFDPTFEPLTGLSNEVLVLARIRETLEALVKIERERLELEKTKMGEERLRKVPPHTPL